MPCIYLAHSKEKFKALFWTCIAMMGGESWYYYLILTNGDNETAQERNMPGV